MSLLEAWAARESGQDGERLRLLAGGRCEAYWGDCIEVLRGLADHSVDSVVTDPPYALVSVVKRFGGDGAAPARYGTDGLYARQSRGFMGKTWDNGDTAHSVAFWAEVLRVLKPGGHVVAFAGTRTYHRLACAIEDAGFEIRDMSAWLYGVGFPKSLDVSKAIDKAAGATREIISSNPNHRAASGVQYEGVYAGSNTGAANITAPATDAARQWEGWGTALKPALEPICLARKPLSEGTVAANVLRWGTGALNIDECRVEMLDADRSRLEEWHDKYAGREYAHNEVLGKFAEKQIRPPHAQGRWPANVLHDGSDEVVGAFPQTDVGSAARFFANFSQCAKADKCDMLLPASDAELFFELSSERVAFALGSAAAALMPQSVLTCTDYQAPFMSVTQSELRLISEVVIEVIQSIGIRCLRASLPQKLSLTSSHVTCAALREQIGITQITINLLRSNGSVGPATFNIIETNADLGVSDFEAKRFHYSAKANKTDRAGSKHPTVKPVSLMRWLCRLVTPPGGLVLDPFAGSGTTGQAAVEEGFRCVLVEREEEYFADIAERFRRMGEP